MTIRAALTHPAAKRLAALVVVYALAWQALFGAGAQLRVLLAETPGLCTLLGFQDPAEPKHALDACAIHCVGHASADAAAVLPAAMLVLTLFGWSVAAIARTAPAPRAALAFYGRAPPR
jgi:hypothetical protein